MMMLRKKKTICLCEHCRDTIAYSSIFYVVFNVLLFVFSSFFVLFQWYCPFVFDFWVWISLLYLSPLFWWGTVSHRLCSFVLECFISQRKIILRNKIHWLFINFGNVTDNESYFVIFIETGLECHVVIFIETNLEPKGVWIFNNYYFLCLLMFKILRYLQV